LDATAHNLFSLEAETAENAHHTAVAQKNAVPLSLAELGKAAAAARTVFYHWNIANDQISWSGNVSEVLGCRAEAISTGRKFAGLLATDNITSRYDTVLRGATKPDKATGDSFEIEYQFKPDGRSAPRAIWIEDTGHWYAGANGTPADVFGAMKIADMRHERDQEMNFLSSCDPLTGMMNRPRMMDALDEAIRNAQTEKTPCAFAIVAVNNLDIMNEAYGFEVADEVIVALADRLRRVMRVGDSIARYSGSKFGIILNGCKASELTPALERFMRAVRDSVIETRFGPVWALLSIGAVSLPSLGQESAAATAHAEEALSEAFRLPSDGYVIYTTSDERREQRLSNARCATEIVGCLRDRLFKLAYQPVVSTKSGQAAFHEALLRMTDSTGAIITAGHLVPIAERLGLIRLIDRSVLQQALSTLSLNPEARLSVNISATTANDPRWNQQLVELLKEVPDLASRLIIELTETAALGDLSLSREFVNALKSAGCGIAIDDFGAGFTSYRNLKELPITMIKLDGSFCRGLATDEANALYVKSLVDLAHAFGIEVVAEWVETQVDADILSALGVDYVQGHHFGEPNIEAPWSPAADAGRFDWAVEAVTEPAAEQRTSEPEIAAAVVEEKIEVAVFDQTQTPVSESLAADDDAALDTRLDLLNSILAEFQQAIDGPAHDQEAADVPARLSAG
jgi:diguanylate cyclase (GGDEF)-like protein